MIVFSLYPHNWGLNITLALSFSQNSNNLPEEVEFGVSNEEIAEIYRLRWQIVLRADEEGQTILVEAYGKSLDTAVLQRRLPCCY